MRNRWIVGVELEPDIRRFSDRQNLFNEVGKTFPHLIIRIDTIIFIG